MINNCDIIKDLLPLYADDVCSPSSREMIETHLRECTDCAKVLKRLKDCEIEATIETEKEEVIRHQAKFFRKKSTIAGLIISAIFFIPVLVCLIVNLATGHGLDWFFIVLTALLAAASLIIVPLMVEKKKGLWTISAFTGSYALMMLSIGLYVKEPGFFETTFIISLPLFVYFWAMFSLIRFPKCSGLAKAGFCLILTGIYIFAIVNIIAFLAGAVISWPEFHPMIWNYNTIDGNVKWTAFLFLLLLGIVFVIIGFIKKGRKEK